MRGETTPTQPQDDQAKFDTEVEETSRLINNTSSSWPAEYGENSEPVPDEVYEKAKEYIATNSADDNPINRNKLFLANHNVAVRERDDAIDQSGFEVSSAVTENERTRLNTIRSGNFISRRFRREFEEDAIEDATAAGHDINYGGHHFPAQNTEQQPPQGEQPVEPQNPQLQ